MGMFNWIEYENLCPSCGSTIKDWQSKEGPCMLDTLPPQKVKHFYARCGTCGVWVNAEVVPLQFQVVLTYEEDSCT